MKKLAITKNKPLCKRLLITVGLLLLCRILAAIPTPGVNTAYFKTLLDLYSSLGFVNVLTGNGLQTMSLMTLSITPYITASINIQLLGLVFKRIEELSQSSMKDDKKKIETATYVMGGVIAFVEAVMMAWGYGAQGLLTKYTWYWVLIVSITWTVFAVFASLIGKLITEKGIGNGVSLILLTNILVSYPSDVTTLANVFIVGKKLPFQIFASVILIAVTVHIYLCIARLRKRNSSQLYWKGKFLSSRQDHFQYPDQALPGRCRSHHLRVHLTDFACSYCNCIRWKRKYFP